MIKINLSVCLRFYKKRAIYNISSNVAAVKSTAMLKNVFISHITVERNSVSQKYVDLLFVSAVRKEFKIYDTVDDLYAIVIDAFYNLTIREKPKENYPTNRADAVYFAIAKIAELKFGEYIAIDCETAERFDSVMCRIVNAIADSLGY